MLLHLLCPRLLGFLIHHDLLDTSLCKAALVIVASSSHQSLLQVAANIIHLWGTACSKPARESFHHQAITEEAAIINPAQTELWCLLISAQSSWLADSSSPELGLVMAAASSWLALLKVTALSFPFGNLLSTVVVTKFFSSVKFDVSFSTVEFLF